jgi:hypothetical protein
VQETLPIQRGVIPQQFAYHTGVETAPFADVFRRAAAATVKVKSWFETARGGPIV